MTRVLSACLSAFALTACATPSHRPATAPELDATAAADTAFRGWESSWLEALAGTDPRLAMRLPRQRVSDAAQRIAAAAAVRGDSDLGTAGGVIDVFSFGVREHELRSLGDDLGQQRAGGANASEERVLLQRLVEEEELRVAEERASPESGSERVRAIMATWGSVSAGREVEERERLVRRGLTDVTGAVAAGKLSRPRSLELEDALDALEHVAVPTGYPEATKVITFLRVELGKAHTPTLGSSPSTIPLERRLGTYLGTREDTASLKGRLEVVLAQLLADAKARLALLPEPARAEVLAAAATHVDEETSCVASEDTRRSSQVRTMKPPPERALVCETLLLGGAEGSRDEAMATVALHDDVAIALWATALDSASNDLDATRTAHPLVSSVSPERQDRLVRAALVSPVRAIAAGLAAELLERDGPGARRERAERWIAYGDAPLDLVAKWLLVSPAKLSARGSRISVDLASTRGVEWLRRGAPPR